MDERTEGRARGADGEQDRLFPYDTVVGVVDEPGALQDAVQALRRTGFGEGDVHVLCGRSGIDRIDAEGERKGFLGKLFRTIDDVGAEREQTRRHVEELREGHFLVVVDAPDEAKVERAHDVLAAHDGHFINHYTRWTTTELEP